MHSHFPLPLAPSLSRTKIVVGLVLKGACWSEALCRRLFFGSTLDTAHGGGGGGGQAIVDQGSLLKEYMRRFRVLINPAFFLPSPSFVVLRTADYPPNFQVTIVTSNPFEWIIPPH
jgi:hypothetical protein